MRIFKILGFFCVVFLFYFFGRGMVDVFMTASSKAGGSIKHFVKHEVLELEAAGEVKTNKLSVYDKGCVITWFVHSYPDKKERNLEVAVEISPSLNCQKEIFHSVHHSILTKITRMWDKKRFFKLKIIGILYKDRDMGKLKFLKELLHQFKFKLGKEINFEDKLYYYLD
ncbi:MAG: hypothetical protein ACJAS4_001806 [Bacteriovoracaceae bacterium]|jgi:hypothetical protein